MIKYNNKILVFIFFLFFTFKSYASVMTYEQFIDDYSIEFQELFMELNLPKIYMIIIKNVLTIISYRKIILKEFSFVKILKAI